MDEAHAESKDGLRISSTRIFTFESCMHGCLPFSISHTLVPFRETNYFAVCALPVEWPASLKSIL